MASTRSPINRSTQRVDHESLLELRQKPARSNGVPRDGAPNGCLCRPEFHRRSSEVQTAASIRKRDDWALNGNPGKTPRNVMSRYPAN